MNGMKHMHDMHATNATDAAAGAMAATDPLDFCLALGRAHASLSLRLEADLGAFHGLSFADFTLLCLLMHAEDGRMPMERLARDLGLAMSALVRKLVLLEKTGLAERVPGPGADICGHAALRAGGRQLMQSAVATVEAHCRQALRPVDPGRLSTAHQVLRALWNDEPHA